MLTISKNLVWPRDLESFKGGNFNTLSLVDCYVQICNGTADGCSPRTELVIMSPITCFSFDETR